MKIVKLDKRHALYKEGFTVAFRLDSFYDKNRPLIDKTLCAMYGAAHLYTNKVHMWGTHWGSITRLGRTYWIGMRNEEDATMVLLGL
jgi:hypothetical protein